MAAPNRLLVSLALASALAPLNSTMVSVALPAIGAELSADVATLTLWLVASYVLVNIVCQSPGGKAGDLFGHRRALAAGQLLFAAGAAGGAFAGGVASLAAARVLMATGGALITPSAMALVRTELPEGRRPQAFGALAAVQGLAAALGPLLGGELVARFGWRTIFLVNVAPVGLSALLAERGARAERPAAPRPRFDAVGSLLLGLGLALVVGGLRLPRSAAGPVAGALGLAALVAFWRWERRAAEPVVDPALFRVRPFLAGSAIIGLQNLALYGLLFQLPFLLAGPLGAGSAQTGRTLLPLMGMVIVFSPLSGRLSLKAGARSAVLAGTALSLAGLCLLALGPVRAPGDLVAPLLLLGAGGGLATAPCQAAALSAVPAERSGMAAALLSTARYLGAIFGVAIIGLTLPDERASADVAAHRLTMGLFAASVALSALAALWLPNVKVRASARRS